MSLPTPHSVGRRAYIAGAKDRHGNPIDTWGDPVPTPVYSIAPKTIVEPETGRFLVVEGLTVQAPPETRFDSRDLVVIDGVEYQIEGGVKDWNRGPFGYSPGISIDLTREEG